MRGVEMRHDHIIEAASVDQVSRSLASFSVSDVHAHVMAEPTSDIPRGRPGRCSGQGPPVLLATARNRLGCTRTARPIAIRLASSRGTCAFWTSGDSVRLRARGRVPAPARPGSRGRSLKPASQVRACRVSGHHGLSRYIPGARGRHSAATGTPARCNQLTPGSIQRHGSHPRAAAPGIFPDGPVIRWQETQAPHARVGSPGAASAVIRHAPREKGAGDECMVIGALMAGGRPRC